MTDLADLIARVEGATGPDRSLDVDLFIVTTPEARNAGRIDRDDLSGVVGWWPHDAPYQAAREVPRYTLSIDAALALVERKLPGFDYIIEHTNGGLTISCLLGTADPDRRVFANTPALAIILALLRSLQAGAQN